MIARDLLVARDISTQFSVGPIGWRRKILTAVDRVDLRIREGEVLALVGESGSGKTSLGRTLLRLIEPASGSIQYDGRELVGMKDTELRALRREMQVIFQDPFASLDPRMTVSQIIAEGLAIHRIGTRATQMLRVQEMLSLVGLDPLVGERYAHALSGGQRQRVGIARALAIQPRFIVADEAVSSLDVSVQAQILRVLSDLRELLGLTMLFITHNLSVVRIIADRIAVMYLGRIVEIGPTAQVFSQPAHPYTRLLLASVPMPDPRVRLNWDFPQGEPVSSLVRPVGCPFQSRCPFAIPRCAEAPPTLIDAGTDHQAACIRISEIRT
jgi:oligopeptide/dipeptide ABC transporter ATP-binding protein